MMVVDVLPAVPEEKPNPVLRVYLEMAVVLCVVSAVVCQAVLTHDLHNPVSSIQTEHYEAVSGARSVEPVRGTGHVETTGVVCHPQPNQQVSFRGALHHRRVVADVEPDGILCYYCGGSRPFT